MNSEEFKIELNKLGIVLSKDQEDLLEKYYDLIIEYNKHTNLTRITDKNEVYLKHYYDSITLIKAIDLNSQTLLDVGTGAGFPGIVLKIVFPQLKVTLIDSLNKRVNFLNIVIKELGLKDIEAIHVRAEEYTPLNREMFDIVTSRAVAQLRVLSEICLPAVKIGGYFIPLKADVEEELVESKNAIETLGSVIEEIVSFKLYKNNYQRTLIKIKRKNKIETKYPRKFSEIKKKPL